MTHQEASTRLDCGVDLLDLVEQVSDGTPPADPAHQADCPYCQQALRRLRTASGQLRDLAGEPVRVPPGLASRVMAQLRRERGRVPIASGVHGTDTASDVVVLQVVRRAARSVDGVRQCSVSLHPATADGELSLTLHLTASLGPSRPDLAEAVRRAVAADVLALTGLRTGRVTVEIDDVEVSADDAPGHPGD